MIGVLLMAYGSPDSLEDVRAYLEDIRGGRSVSDDAVAELAERYRRAGCPSPLLETTRGQAAKLQEVLGDGYTVRIGMKHWQPRIQEAVTDLVREGADPIVAIAAAPHESRISIGGYAQRVERACIDLGGGPTLRMVRSWYDQPAFVDLWARNLHAAIASTPELPVLFTAHSLPARILAESDPYRDQLLDSARRIAQAAGVRRWELAFQSESATGEPWLGPDVNERLEQLAADGVAGVAIAPIGFVCDHLEILFDLDIECAELAAKLRLELRRVQLPNTDRQLAEAMAGAIRAALHAEPATMT